MPTLRTRRLALPLAFLLARLLTSPPPAAAQEVSTPAAAAPAVCSRTWVGREAEIEEALAGRAVLRLEAVPIGVTKPQRGYLEAGGPVARFAWKALPPGRKVSGYYESYKAEIAAYHLDRLLGLGMVPPVVERTVDGRRGAAVMWIEETKGWDKAKPINGPEPRWSQQVSRMKLFDQLIANVDRNQGNLLYDSDWHLFLIDHSRAFTTRTSLDGISAPSLVDRETWQKMDALTAGELERALGAWLTADERQALLARRDRMRAAIATMVKAKSAARVFVG